MIAVLLGEPVQKLPGNLRLAEANQAVHLLCARPGDYEMRCGEPPGQRLHGLEGGQRRGIMAPRLLRLT